jgi:arylsulfatase A-like enzyme
LQEKNLLENTIVVYMADHGDYVTDYGLMHKGVETPEVLTRIPLVWAGWGIQQKPADKTNFVSIADVMPTLCEALGADIPHGAQGRSIWPMLQGKEYPREEFRSIYSEVGIGGLHYDASDHVPYSIAKIPGPPGAHPSFDELNQVTQSGYLKMVRMGDWKLTFDMMGSGQLYNVASDPYELKNLYGDRSLAGMQARLHEELLAWTIRSQDTLPTARYKTKWCPRNWYHS